MKLNNKDGKIDGKLPLHKPPVINAEAEPENMEDRMNKMYELTVWLANELEKSRIADYTQLLHRPFRLIWLNLLSGTARGVGYGIGLTLFGATIIYLLQALGALNLPIIGDYIADLVRIVQRQLQL
ncbi:hypothetical protein GCM10010917_02140 [Paenibacillus physcomitrellae]|uniref:Signal transduction histidine kinase n=2 Tax=Paenibacillus physcomitrellae TaxID=1619311 RepID=A0ABQ1FME6_9BACL|nr:hypothetical protein GCM10010917_02140 [Paenibacillus physcomitrellae]